MFGEIEMHLVLEDLSRRIVLDPEVALIHARNGGVSARSVQGPCDRI